MGNKKKSFFLLLTAVVLAVAGTGYYLYNKPGLNVQNAEGQKVTATELYSTFIRDSTKAKKSYTNQVLEVAGLVIKASENQQRQQIIMLRTNADGAAINCTLEEKAGEIKLGSNIIVKGICNGIGEADVDLGIMGDVYLIRCYILK